MLIALALTLAVVVIVVAALAGLTAYFLERDMKEY